jgi:hypothetical protein
MVGFGTDFLSASQSFLVKKVKPKYDQRLIALSDFVNVLPCTVMGSEDNDSVERKIQNNNTM